MDLGLTGRRALVLGSTAGLGLAVATALAHEGARVVLCGRRGDRARELAAGLPGAVGLAVDLTHDGVAGLVTEAEAAIGPLDVVVLNSGGPPPGGAADLSTTPSERRWRPCCWTRSNWFKCPAQGHAPAPPGWSRVSPSDRAVCRRQLPGLVLSNVARAGLAGYLKTLAGEVAADGVTVNMLLPGRLVDRPRRPRGMNSTQGERSGTSLEEVRDASRRWIPAGVDAGTTRSSVQSPPSCAAAPPPT